MKRILISVLAAAAFALGAADYDFTELDRLLEGWMDAGVYPGLSFLVVKDGKPIYERSLGEHTPATTEFIASAGKWYAAACIMTLVDEGKLSLDDPAEKWIPEFKGDPKGKATLRQLLSHTSGYISYQPVGHDDNYATLQESVVALLPRKLVTRPGARWNYGGIAMQIAGRMAERASGLVWEQLWEQKIGKPLGLTDTAWVPVDPRHIPKLSGGARSSLRDYAKFLEMLSNNGTYRGKRILSPEAVKEMGRDQLNGAAVPKDVFVEAYCGGKHPGIYGLGHWRESEDARGNVLIESSPGWAGTYPWIDRGRGLYAVLVAHKNQIRLNAMYAGSALPRLVGKIVDSTR